jgi:hypothetical protein
MCPEEVGVIPFVGYLPVNAEIAEVDFGAWNLSGLTNQELGSRRAICCWLTWTKRVADVG